MLSKILETEQRYNDLLPVERLQYRAPANLIKVAGEWSETVWRVAEQLGPMPLTAKQITRGLQLAQNSVFICGVHRSGTTLLQDMLDGHPDLVVLPSEGTYYTNQEPKLQAMPHTEWAGFLGREWLRRIANPINQAPYWLLGRSAHDSSPYVDFARYVMAWWDVTDHKPGTQWPHLAVVLAYACSANKLSAKLWVDKTPTNERFINRIWQEMPAAKIIQMVREPIATLASRKKMEPSISLQNALRYLKNSFNIAARQKQVNNSNYLLLRYEDLCNEPEAATKQLAGFLGIEVSPMLSQPSVAGRPAHANSSFTNETKAGVIFKPNQHPQQEILSVAEKQLIAACIGDLAAKHGYPLTKVGFLCSLYLKLRFRLFR